MAKRKALFTVSLIGTIVLCGCGAQHSVQSAAPPGNAVLSYPNSVDENWTTVLMSVPNTKQAGIDGRVATVRVYNRQQPYADELTMDIDGNLGIRGTVYSRSSKREKKEISAYRGDALSILRDVRIVSYLYRNEPRDAPRHVGLIAEDSPSILTGRQHDSFNLNNSIAVNMAATQELDRQVRELRREIAELQRELVLLRKSKR